MRRFSRVGNWKGKTTTEKKRNRWVCVGGSGSVACELCVPDQWEDLFSGKLLWRGMKAGDILMPLH